MTPHAADISADATGSRAAGAQQIRSAERHSSKEARSLASLARRCVPATEAPLGCDGLWNSYWASGSRSDRNNLIELHIYLIDRVVRRLPYDVRRYWSDEDLRSFGTFGLIDAVERRQAELADLSFATYADTRIRGAIYDELRALDWLPRSARRKAIDFRAAEDELRVSLKRNPGYNEVLAAMDVTTRAQSRATALAVCRSQLTSLEDRLNPDSQASQLSQLQSGDDVEEELFSNIDHLELSAALARLPDRQRAILAYRYCDHLTLQQVGDLSGVSYSRICQIEQATLRDLRGALEVAEVA